MQLCHIHFYQKIARKKVARVNAALGEVMKTIHDAGINCLCDKRVVAWLDDRRVLRNFPVALLNECWL